MALITGTQLPARRARRPAAGRRGPRRRGRRARHRGNARGAGHVDGLAGAADEQRAGQPRELGEDALDARRVRRGGGPSRTKRRTGAERMRPGGADANRCARRMSGWNGTHSQSGQQFRGDAGRVRQVRPGGHPPGGKSRLEDVGLMPDLTPGVPTALVAAGAAGRRPEPGAVHRPGHQHVPRRASTRSPSSTRGPDGEVHIDAIVGASMRGAGPLGCCSPTPTPTTGRARHASSKATGAEVLAYGKHRDKDSTVVPDRTITEGDTIEGSE